MQSSDLMKARRSPSPAYGSVSVDEEAKVSKVPCYPDGDGVYAAGSWSEGLVSYPGRSVILPRVIRCYWRCELSGWNGGSQPRP